MSFAALRDRARPILIFGKAKDARVEQQYDELARHDRALDDRDVQVVLLTDITILHDGPGVPEVRFTSNEQTQLRQRFHIAPNDFTVILIGKDGGEKLRSSTPIPWNKLAATIDAMPMRQAETRNR